MGGSPHCFPPPFTGGFLLPRIPVQDAPQIRPEQCRSPPVGRVEASSPGTGRCSRSLWADHAWGDTVPYPSPIRGCAPVGWVAGPRGGGWEPPATPPCSQLVGSLRVTPGPPGGWGTRVLAFSQQESRLPGWGGLLSAEPAAGGEPALCSRPGTLLSWPLLPLSLTSPPFYFSSYLYFLFSLPLLRLVWFDLSFSLTPTLSFCAVPIFLHCLSSDAVTYPSPVSSQLSSLSLSSVYLSI